MDMNRRTKETTHFDTSTDNIPRKFSGETVLGCSTSRSHLNSTRRAIAEISRPAVPRHSDGEIQKLPRRLLPRTFSRSYGSLREDNRRTRTSERFRVFLLRNTFYGEKLLYVSLETVAIVCAVFAAAHATLLAAPILSTGVSNSARSQDAIGNYAFNYGIANGLGATNSRAEVGDAHGNKIGSYTITDIDGRARRVDYVADSLGFRTTVNTNEPGTALSAPAAAAIVSPYAAPVAPVAAAPAVVAAAPAVVAAAPAYAAAPIYAAAPLLAGPAAPVAYSSVISHGAIAAPLGYGAGLIGAPFAKSLIL